MPTFNKELIEYFSTFKALLNDTESRKNIDTLELNFDYAQANVVYVNSLFEKEINSINTLEPSNVRFDNGKLETNNVVIAFTDTDNEARVMMECKSQSIMPLYCYCQIDDAYILVIPKCKNAFEYLTSPDRSSKDYTDFFVDICQGLSVLKLHGYVHSNINANTLYVQNSTGLIGNLVSVIKNDEQQGVGSYELDLRNTASAIQYCHENKQLPWIKAIDDKLHEVINDLTNGIENKITSCEDAIKYLTGESPEPILNKTEKAVTLQKHKETAVTSPAKHEKAVAPPVKHETAAPSPTPDSNETATIKKDAKKEVEIDEILQEAAEAAPPVIDRLAIKICDIISSIETSGDKISVNKKITACKVLLTGSNSVNNYKTCKKIVENELDNSTCACLNAYAAFAILSKTQDTSYNNEYYQAMEMLEEHYYNNPNAMYLYAYFFSKIAIPNKELDSEAIIKEAADRGSVLAMVKYGSHCLRINNKGLQIKGLEYIAKAVDNHFDFGKSIISKYFSNTSNIISPKLIEEYSRYIVTDIEIANYGEERNWFIGFI